MESAKDYLRQIRRIDEQVNSKLAEVERLNDMLTRITPILKDDGGAHADGNQDKFSGAIAKIVDLKDEINRDIDRLVDLKKEAYDLLHGVQNQTYQTLLHKRYFLFESFEKIAVDLGYTYRNVCYIHGKALVAFGEVLDEERRAHEKD